MCVRELWVHLFALRNGKAIWAKEITYNDKLDFRISCSSFYFYFFHSVNRFDSGLFHTSLTTIHIRKTWCNKGCDMRTKWRWIACTECFTGKNGREAKNPSHQQSIVFMVATSNSMLLIPFNRFFFASKSSWIQLVKS